MLLSYCILIMLLSAAMLLSVKTGKLDIRASIAGGVIGFLIFQGAGFTGIGMLAAFFISGTLATSHRPDVKQKLGFAELNGGRRTVNQVIANAGIPALLGLVIWLLPVHATVLKLMMAASLASATADTLSSELGMVYGRTCYDILTFKKGDRGANGSISLEGTIAGVFGSAIIAIIYSLNHGMGWHFGWIVIAGTTGNFTDTVLGATLEKRGYLGNNIVNFLNTLVAACMVYILYCN